VKIEIQLANDLGKRLSDGAIALEFRLGRIDPYISLCEEIVLDFSEVRSANSSFINALISGTIEEHGEKALDVLVFKGCNAVIQVLVEAAIYLGLQKSGTQEPA